VPFDLILQGGVVVDGTGAQARRGDVGIQGDRITGLGDLAAAATKERIDVTGRTVVPGFVDLHTHSDLSLLSDGRARSKVMQGVTTEVVGNCGFSPFPSPEARRLEVRQSVALIDVDPAVEWRWESFGQYLDAVRAARPAVNVVSMAGHIPLRVASAGFARDVSDTPLRKGLGDALDAGAAGFSVGLMYPPSMWADQSELVALAEVAADRDRLLAVHMRDYGDQLVEAVAETLAIAELAAVRLQISHLAVAGRRNWGSVERALDMIDRSRSAGLDVAIDIYPYLAGSANLSQLLPDWAQAGTPDEVVARLGDTTTREKVLAHWASGLRFGWEEVEVSWMPDEADPAIGLNIASIAARLGVPGSEAALRLIEESGGRAQMVAYGRSEEDLDAALTHSSCAIGSDGLALDPDGASGAGRPHPRSFGTYPRLFARYVRGRKLLSLERAVEMATSRPAHRIGLEGRGRIALDCYADLCVMDPESICDVATFKDPKQFPVGIDHVFVNGAHVVAYGRQVNDMRPGRVLRCA
jgi:N-acyl-D-amino-acid deacylase